MRRRRWWRRPGGVAVSSRRQPARGAFAAARLERRGGGGALRNRHPRSDSVALAVDKRCGAFLGSFGAASVGRPAEALLNPRGESGGARTRRKARVRTRGLLVCGARGRGRTVLCLSLSLFSRHFGAAAAVSRGVVMEAIAASSAGGGSAFAASQPGSQSSGDGLAHTAAAPGEGTAVVAGDEGSLLRRNRTDQRGERCGARVMGLAGQRRRCRSRAPHGSSRRAR